MPEQTVFRELRCPYCGRKLAEAKGGCGIISIKCPRCKHINQFK